MVPGWFLQSRSPLSRALVAVFLPAAATFVTAAIPALGRTNPYLLPLMAAAAAAGFAGTAAGLLATCLASLATVYFVIPPPDSFALDADQSFAAASFLFLAVASVLLIGGLKTLLQREQEAREELTAVMDAIPAAVLIARDPECRVVVGNREGSRLAGIGNGAASASDEHRVFAPLRFRIRRDGEDLPPDEMPLLKAAKTGRGVDDQDLEVVGGDGNRQVHGSAVPLFGKDGSVRGAVAAFLDVTGRRQIEMELESLRREQIRELTKADEQKNIFLAILGHELRNPLNAIVAAVRVLQHERSGELDRQWAVRAIDHQAGHLTRIIEDLLNLSRIAQGKLELRRQVLDVREPVRRALDMTHSLFLEREHDLRITLGTAPLVVEGDEHRLTQVIVNLLNNAAKYTRPRGQIMVSVSREDGDAVIRVRDNGPGIAPERLARIFEPFAQLPEFHDRSRGGLGIGLSIVQRLVEMHDGTVEVTSGGLGTGTEFIVRLPVSRAALSAVTHPPRSRSTVHRRVLVVDDDEDSARGIASLLAMEGHETQTACDGTAALRESQSFRPDVVVLDIGLPEMDGYETARRIRALVPGHEPRLIALTGFGQPHDVDKSREAGFAEHLVKPVRVEMLLDAIAGPADRGV